MMERTKNTLKGFIRYGMCTVKAAGDERNKQEPI